jgi:prepilin-type N-terminal cleavage/methylation domain-containing protein
MKLIKNNNGFTLIELIITAVVVQILAAIAITAYIGVVEKSKVARVTRTASASTSDLQLWLDSSLSTTRNIREIDTNMDGDIDSDDMTNLELFEAGVANTYVEMRTTVINDWSPWFDRPMWNTDDPDSNDTRGTISLSQPLSNQLIIVAKEKNGFVVYEQVLFK